MIRSIIVALAVGVALASQPAHAIIYDWIEGIHQRTNPSPNGPWTYGSKATLGGEFLKMRRSNFRTRLNEVTFQQWLDEGPGANIEANLLDMFAEDPYLGGRAANSMTLHPGADGHYAFLRFTAPAAGNYTFNVGFTGNSANVTTTDVHVLINNMDMYSGSVSSTRVGEVLGTGPTFTPAVPFPLAAGGTIDIAVGDGGNGHGYDLTGISGWIERIEGGVVNVPEPASATLVGCALLALRRRRRQG
jgi:hypothetical protein